MHRGISSRQTADVCNSHETRSFYCFIITTVTCAKYIEIPVIVQWRTQGGIDAPSWPLTTPPKIVLQMTILGHLFEKFSALLHSA